MTWEIGHPCAAVLTREQSGRGGPAPLSRCGKRDDEKPMAFRGENWCCENHRKLYEEQHGGS